MGASGHILLADDEESFLSTTARLLRREGYTCDCAKDASTAIQMLREQEYDVLISDIRMPGNDDLELIREASQIAKGLPVILVTGFPTVQTAIQSVGVNVSSYLVKPIDFATLLEQAQIAIQKRRLFKGIASAEERLRQTSDDLAHLKEALEENLTDNFPGAVESFRAHTYRNIASSLLDACHLNEAMRANSQQVNACNLLECTTLDALTEAMRETIDVLESTKLAFKSKDLGELRKKLEDLVSKTERG